MIKPQQRCNHPMFCNLKVIRQDIP
uniref:Uncharacterized protein n=1 Tax=Rhizophora mucronata TaxID=61149 RepID=A0A2P2PNN4_RHIMU